MSAPQKSPDPRRDVLANMREEAFHNIGAACNYGRIAQSFLELADDGGADYAISMAQAYFQSALRNFSPLRDIVDVRRERTGGGN